MIILLYIALHSYAKIHSQNSTNAVINVNNQIVELVYIFIWKRHMTLFIR